MRGVVAAVIVVLLVLGLWHLAGDRVSGGIGGDDLMQLAYLGVLASFVGWGFFTGGWRDVRADIRNLLFWLGALLILTGLYSFKDDVKSFGQRIAGTAMPGTAIQRSAGEFAVTRSRGGMFVVDGAVQGAGVRFLFDTGASSVVLTAEDAKRAGITPGDSDFTVRTLTANGVAMAAPVLLDSVSAGGITLSKVRGLVSKPGALNRSLLGHDFLDRLSSYEVRGDQLILRK